MADCKRKITFSNGCVFTGEGFGADKQVLGPVSFNTAMVGYQELLSDPASLGEIMTMTYPLIGNYGLADEDYESHQCFAGGLLVREYNDIPSNFRYTKTLQDVMEDNGIPGIHGLDTRQITRMLRMEGRLKGLISDDALPHEQAMALLQAYEEPTNPVEQVSCKKLWYARTANFVYNVVALDLGIKRSVIQALNQRGCNVIILPFSTTAQEIQALRPDGLLISGGPGSPSHLPQVIDTVKALQGRLPMLGIGLGCQVLAVANGYEIFPMPGPGHHGGNHPVKNLETGKIEFTSQGHHQVVGKEPLCPSSLTVSHINLLDQSVEGLKDDSRRLLAVQYSPESAPGPQDSYYWFDQFITYIHHYQQERSALHA
ncbi:MAG: glutamine-hydrolyzing carbamoyl-phosphate synthase small subunit [Clostridiales bacterium]|nr:glutamine-hydrolyzing carbamoyl-phosphate synthase small subunit [Clostridiales bacterium]